VDPPSPPRKPIVQAERDLAEGKVDTDLRARAAEVFERAIARRRRSR
jgi:DNA-directed RNA polymerase subunit K/omega